MIVLAFGIVLGLVPPSAAAEAGCGRVDAQAERALPAGTLVTDLDLDGGPRLREFFLAENLNEVDEDGEPVGGSLDLALPMPVGPPPLAPVIAGSSLALLEKATSLRLRGTVQLRL